MDMSMRKRAGSLMLALCLLLALCPMCFSNASAAESTTIDDLEIVRALGIIQGDESGNLNLSANVTRAEFTKMTVAASSYRDTIGEGTGYSLFKDVKSDYWASEYIKTAVEEGWFVGYTDGTFRPNNTITLAEAATTLLRLLGYDSSSLAGSFPTAQMTKAKSIGLLDNITGTASTALTRSDCVTLFYNLMVTENSSGTYYLNSLEPSQNLVSSDGEISLVALVNENMTGPIQASSDWQSGLPFTASNATYYRNGQEVTASTIQTNDVLYYSQSMRTVWAFSNKVSGTITAVSPSASDPSSVTVAGQTYSIDTASAAYDLSSLGEFQVGSVVTLLLGRDGGVAFAVSTSSTSSSNLGVIVSTGDSTFTDSSGQTYTSDAITILGLDGSTYVYQNEKGTSYSNGNVVRVTVTSSGTTIQTISGGSISGKVNSAGTYLGSTAFADDVQIMDVYDESGKVISTSRLAGATISSSDVSYVSTNSSGEINVLILKDFTGDLHTYGILTKISSSTSTSDDDTTTTYTYTYEVSGSTYTWSDSVDRNLKRGPIEICTSDGEISTFLSMDSMSIDTVSGNTVTGDGKTQTLSDDVAVYVYNDVTGGYDYSSLGHVTSGSYTLTGYYDNVTSAGGRIRVLIAH